MKEVLTLKISDFLRIINVWNNLPYDIVNANTTNCFKNRLDRHLREYMYQRKITLYDHIA